MPIVRQTVTESEYAVMRVLWDSGRGMTVAEVLRALDGSEWTPSTVSTFLQRLLGKGVVKCEKKGKSNLYIPVLRREEYDSGETASFLSRLYDGSAKKLVAALYAENRLSAEDIAELRALFSLD